MKKILSLILGLMLLLTAICAASADEIPQPEGGKKFEGDWAIMGMKVEVDYEEEGYRVALEAYNKDELKGTVWEYNCYYNEDKDVLESVSSLKYDYTLDPETFDRIAGEDAYNDFDEDDQTTVFAVNAEGKLTWADGRENAGADLEFQPIGRFDGIWKNDAEEVYTEISWEGLNDEETFYYTVFIRRGVDEHAVEFNMQGLYNWDSGKLEAEGTTTDDDGETYEAFFSMQDDGKLLFEAANGIELEYVDPMMDNG